MESAEGDVAIRKVEAEVDALGAVLAPAGSRPPGTQVTLLASRNLEPHMHRHISSYENETKTIPSRWWSSADQDQDRRTHFPLSISCMCKGLACISCMLDDNS